MREDRKEFDAIIQNKQIIKYIYRKLKTKKKQKLKKNIKYRKYKILFMVWLGWYN